MNQFEENWFEIYEETSTIRMVVAGLLGLFAFLIISLAVAELIYPMPDPKPAVRTVTVVTESFPSVAPKADKIIAQPDSDSITIVKTIPVVPLWRPEVSNPRFEPLPAPVIAQTEFPSLPKPKADKPERTGDVCARHGGHRETTPGKRGGWHCVYGKKS